MLNIKNALVLTFTALALMAASAAPLAAATHLSLPWKTGAADPCEKDCKMRADSCREQCAHPEEPEQCIVDCSRSECDDSCNKLEDGCKRHCQSPKG
ncbi:MAG: hypothetical protein J2P49_08560 [Methylocapsa sp.]|nr:hypothetical protein [Methylocapsa sp.]